MFGQQQNTPFGGGGGFGQQTNTAPAFGSPAAAAPTGGLFGAASPAPAFGAPAGGNTFGGGGGGFGQPAAAPAGGMFGQPAPAAGGGLFGQPAAATNPPAAGGFGSTFGQPAPAPGAFGAPAPATGGGLFGQPAPAPAFGAPAAPAGGGLFGNTTTNTTSPFGGGAPAAGGFGAAPSPATGGFGSTFGQPAPAPFGSPAPAGGGGLFGQPAPAPAFGAPAPATGGLFGQPAPAPAFGAAPAPFGAPAPAGGGLFGAPAPGTGAFGAPAATSPFGGQPAAQGPHEGTSAVPFQVTSRKDNNNTINLQSITAMTQYENKSFEELRFEDYSKGNKGTASATTPTAGGFGGFGAQPAPAPFGAPAPATGGGLFGQPAPAPGAFGAPAPATGGLFGQPAPAPAFGAAPAPGGGLFGSPAPAPFGSPAPAPGGLFGSPAPAPFGAPAPGGGLFGAKSPAPAFGAPAGGGMFGQPAPAPFGAPAPATGGLFGQPAPAPFGQPAPAPFGAPAPTTGGLFGQPTPAPFGQPAPAPFGAPSPGGLFGQPAPAPAFGAPAPGGLFGQPAPAPFGAAPQPVGSGLFGAQPQPVQQAPPQAVIPTGAVIIPPTADEATNLAMKAMLKSLEEKEKLDSWKGESGKSEASTPTSVSESTAILEKRRPTYQEGSAMFSFESPSIRKTRPRGFPKTESPGKTTVALSSVGRGASDRSSLMPPDSNFRSPIMQLKIQPGAISKPRLRALPPPLDSVAERAESPKETVDPPPTETPQPKETAGAEARQTPTSDQAKPSETALVPVNQISPALAAYYQQTINSPVDHAQVSTPAAKKSAAAPKLTKKGYETTPPIEELDTFGEAELGNVPAFSVSRPGYGKVEWEGTVDVRHADLDSIVVIKPKDVMVYTEEEQLGTKPAVGTRLNRPAQITYYEVFPKDNPDASTEDKEKFAEKLKKISRKIGAEFVGYNLISGEWQIKVQHFSRYAFVDDDSDDDDEQPEQVTMPEEPWGQPQSILHRKATPFKPSQGNVAFDMKIMSPEETVFTIAKIRESVSASAEKTLAEARAEQLAARPLPMDVEPDEVEEEEGEEEPIENECVPPTRAELSKARSGFSITSSILGEKRTSSIDAGLRMGRSFRVSFAPDGTFFVPRAKSNCSSIVVKYPVHGPNESPNEEGKFEFLETHLKCSDKETLAGEDCPLYALPRSYPNNGTTQTHAAFVDTLQSFSSLHGNSDEGKSTFKLVARLLDSKLNGTGEPRRTALLEWLVEECEDSVSDDVSKFLAMQSSVAAIFSALSGGDVERACCIAADAGYHELSAVIATMSAIGAEKDDLAKMIAESGAMPSISSELDRLTKAIGGKNIFEDGRYRDGSSGLDWRKRLALRALSSSDDHISQLVNDYVNDVKKGTVPAPTPYNGCNCDSVQFKVLRAFSSVDSLKLSDIVQPKGFTTFQNDSSLSFHLAAAIGGAIPFDGASEDVEKVCTSFAAQLLCEEEFAWAVFVLLCVLPGTTPDVCRRRIDSAKSIVVRHYNQGDEGSENSRKFLEEEIGVPTLWFEEALSNQALTVVDYVSHTLKFDPEAALRVLEYKYLPNVFFLSRGQIEELMGTIEGMANARNSVAAGVVRFFKLDEKLRLDPDVSKLDKLLHEHNYLVDFFKSRLSTIGSPPGHYRFYEENEMRVSLPSMLREALSKLSEIRLQLAALAHDANVELKS